MKLNKLKKLIKDNHFLSLAGNVVSSGIGAVCIMLLSRYLSKDDLGIWLFFFTASNFFEMMKSGFINNALVKFVSGTGDSDFRCHLHGSAWVLSSVFLFVSAVICYILYIFVTIVPVNLKYFLLFYPLYSLFFAPVMLGISSMMAYGRFGAVFCIKAAYGILFITGILLAIHTGHNQGVHIIFTQIAALSCTSILSVFTGWSGIRHIFKFNIQTLKTIVNFGKYVTITSLGVNLLKTSDTFLIGLMMTNANVAIFAVPMKLLEVFEIIVDSVRDVAMTNISKVSSKINEVRELFGKYAGATLILIFPVLIAAFIFAGEIILIFAGSKYAGLTAPINVFRIFIASCGFMVVDRFAGVTLDATNRPRLNSFKVLVMAAINIAGDVIVIHFFNKLEYVALVTSINLFSGMFIGIIILKREMRIEVSQILPKGYSVIREYYRHIFAVK